MGSADGPAVRLALTETAAAGAPGGGSAPAIRVLPPLLVNQIAAGEVIERPASVVKELVENAIDAGAGRIAVELEAGGTSLVRVSDDGRGLARHELGLALTPHATSKIAEAGDLDRIATMGFRGEALASIASVARVSIRSRVAGSEAGWSIAQEGDTRHEPSPAAGPVGTAVTVRDLFFNTPARRKFLRTERTERGRCLDWVRDLAMAHPMIGFTVTEGGRSLLELAPEQGPRRRAVELLGRELEGELLEVSVDRFDDERGVLVWGLVGRPSVARPTARAQHLFLNGRAVRDRGVQHALKEAYRGLIEPGRHPTAVLMLETAPSAVDVNVHPAKLEVRFRDGSAVHRAVLSGVRRALASADLTPRAGLRGETGDGAGGVACGVAGAAGSSGGGRAMFGPCDSGGSAAAFAERVRQARAGWPVSDAPAGPGRVLEAVSGFGSGARDGPGVPATAWGVAPAAGAEGASGVGADPGRADAPAGRAVQVLDRYLLVEEDDGLVLIDQHALHERVMFQTLLARLEAGGGRLESQALLTPAVAGCSSAALDLLDADAAGLDQPGTDRPGTDRPGPDRPGAGGDGVPLARLLTSLGIEASRLGPGEVGVRSFPTLLLSRGVEPGAFVGELLEKAERGELTGRDAADGPGGGHERAVHEVLDMMACKAAVKAGDRLSQPEVDELVRLRGSVDRSSACPHGRPTSVRIGSVELERLFHRR